MQCLQVPPHPSDLSVLERQRARLGCLQDQQSAAAAYDPCVDGDYCMQRSSLFPLQAASSIHGLHGGSEKKESTLDCFVAGWPDLAAGVQYPDPGAANNAEETASATVSNSSSRKRRAKNSPRSKLQQEKGKDDSDCKRIKEEGGGGATWESSKQQNNGKEASNSGDTSKENDKPAKTNYIHVRARRGQATDSHSLAERVRRERISQRMKYLQDLVPGCSKITGKAGMLDEIINYVQSLQRQVEFLSMKLAAVNPVMDVNIDSFFGREIINPACRSMGVSSEMLDHPPCLPFNSLQAHPCSALDIFMDSSSDLVLRQASSTPVAVPDAAASFGSCLNVSGSANSNVWNASLQNLYGVEFQLGRGTGFPFQSSQELFSQEINALPSNLKMEM